MHVVVIGAGAHGTSAALHLARAGADVTVIERFGAPAEGPTGRSSAICRAYYTNPFLAQVARDSLEHFADFAAFLDQDLPNGFRRSGALYLHGAGDLDTAVTTRVMLHGIGTETQHLTAGEVQDLHPGFSLDGVGFGVWEPDAGQADPGATTMSMMTAARQAGAAVRYRTSVAAITAEDGGPGVVLTDGEAVSGDRVLVAAGPWTKPLLATCGVELPLTVERHIVTLQGWGPIRPLPFVMADLTTSVYLTLEGEGQFGLGPLDAGPIVDVDTNSSEVSLDEHTELLGRAADRLPVFEDAELRGGWASVYDVSPDWQPVIGEVADRVFVDAGTSGHGFKLAPELGRHVADLVLGSAGDARLDDFHPRRFDTDHHLAAGFGANPIIG